jgi:hypothetical protein
MSPCPDRRFACPWILLTLLALASAFLPFPASTGSAGSASIPAPAGLFPPGVSADSPPEILLQSFLGIPYRPDGAINAAGEYTLFADPSRRFASPGLNCSGLTLAASRFLLRRNFTLAEVMRDRHNDSGPGAPHGQDWDFGWDLLMNISEGFERSLLLPGGQSLDPALGDAFAPRGFDLQDDATWKELPARLRQGYVYLLSFNVEGRLKGYGLVHYHVGLIHVAPDGKAWLYQTTGRGKVANRRDVARPEGIASLRKAFANSGKERRMLWVLETKLPEGVSH